MGGKLEGTTVKKKKHSTIVNLLIEANANVSIRTFAGNTALAFGKSNLIQLQFKYIFF
jgi:hypothetical protein